MILRYSTLAIYVLLIGCVGYIADVSSTFHVSGEIRANTLGESGAARKPILTLQDVNLIETRGQDRPVIAARELTVGEEFDFTENYLWGTVTHDITAGIEFTDEKVQVSIDLEGCKSWSLIVDLSGLPKENGATLIDLGIVELEC